MQNNSYVAPPHVILNLINDIKNVICKSNIGTTKKLKIAADMVHDETPIYEAPDGTLQGFILNLFF